MNRLLLSLIVFCANYCMVIAQEDYHSLLKQGKQWNYKVEHMGEQGVVRTFYDRLEGDSIVNGKEYFKLYKYQDESCRCTALLREEGKKVYILRDGNTEEALLYDFGVEMGKSVLVNYNSEMVVSNNKEIIVKNVPRLCICLHLANFPALSVTWIEGVSCLEYGLLIPDGDIPTNGTTVTLVSCYEDDMCIYDINEPLRSVSQGGSGTTTGMNRQVGKDTFTNHHTLFDLQGRRLTDTPPRGPYIRDGKKYVIK